MAQRQRLTNKERGFVRDILAGENGTQAALNNYDTTDYNTAAVIASENLSKPKIKELLDKAFPDDELYKLHREGLYDDDLRVRHLYLETAYKLKNSYGSRGDTPPPSVAVQVNVHLEELAKKLGDELEKEMTNDPNRKT